MGVEHAVLLIVILLAALGLVLLQRREGAVFAADKTDALRHLIGHEVILYVGTRVLFGKRGTLAAVDVHRRCVRLEHGRKHRDIPLDRILAVSDVDERMRFTF